MLVNFKAYPATKKVTFTCTCCGKPRRTVTFKRECTVNPYNRGDDGLPRTAEQVRQQSKDAVAVDVAEFLREPWCKACEDTLGWDDRKRLRERRKAGGE